MTPDEIQALERLEAEATPGPWDVDVRQGGCADVTAGDRMSFTATTADAAFIAALRNAAPELLAAARERDAIVAAREEYTAKFKAAGDAIDAAKSDQIDALLGMADGFEDVPEDAPDRARLIAGARAMRAGAIALAAGGRCAYCGWQPEGAEPLTVAARDAGMQAHIVVCEKHPAAKLRAERDEAVAARDAAEAASREAQAGYADVVAKLRLARAEAEALRAEVERLIRDRDSWAAAAKANHAMAVERLDACDRLRAEVEAAERVGRVAEHERDTCAEQLAAANGRVAALEGGVRLGAATVATAAEWMYALERPAVQAKFKAVEGKLLALAAPAQPDKPEACAFCPACAFHDPHPGGPCPVKFSDNMMCPCQASPADAGQPAATRREQLSRLAEEMAPLPSVLLASQPEELTAVKSPADDAQSDGMAPTSAATIARHNEAVAADARAAALREASEVCASLPAKVGPGDYPEGYCDAAEACASAILALLGTPERWCSQCDAVCTPCATCRLPVLPAGVAPWTGSPPAAPDPDAQWNAAVEKAATTCESIGARNKSATALRSLAVAAIRALARPGAPK